MRSLTDHSGLKFSSLADDRGHAALGDFAELHQRRVADALRDVLLDSGGQGRGSHENLLVVREVAIKGARIDLNKGGSLARPFRRPRTRVASVTNLWRRRMLGLEV